MSLGSPKKVEREMGGLEMICVYLEPVNVLYFGG